MRLYSHLLEVDLDQRSLTIMSLSPLSLCHTRFDLDQSLSEADMKRSRYDLSVKLLWMRMNLAGIKRRCWRMMKLTTPGHLMFKYLNQCHYPGGWRHLKVLTNLCTDWMIKLHNVTHTDTDFYWIRDIAQSQHVYWPGSLTWSPKLSGSYKPAPGPLCPGGEFETNWSQPLSPSLKMTPGTL